MAVQQQAIPIRARSIPSWLIWGAAIGVVQIFAVVTFAPLGVSTAYPQFVGLALDSLFPGFAADQLYLREIGTAVGWEMMLVAGLALGAVLSMVVGRLSGDQRVGETSVAAVLVRGFGNGASARYMRMFLGGFLFMFGARLAGGCTTGHILSGTAQMAISSLIFGSAVFAAGYLTARLFFTEPAELAGRNN